MPEVYHPAERTRRTDSLDDRLELSSELSLNPFAGTHSANRCKRSPGAVKPWRVVSRTFVMALYSD